MAAAYGVFANDGLYLTPGGSEPERVLKAATARTVRSMLEGVVTGEQATGKAARVPGVRVGGKTGTSDDPDCEQCAHGPGTFASFVGIVPLDRPRFVIYVGVGQPTKEGSGGTIAAPAFARIASRALALN
jgi:cell division protein FtsI (penicillin-binding protein 3)